LAVTAFRNFMHIAAPYIGTSFGLLTVPIDSRASLLRCSHLTIRNALRGNGTKWGKGSSDFDS